MLCLLTQDFPVSTDPEDRTFRDFSDYNPAFSISDDQQVPNRAVSLPCQGRRQRSAEKVVVLAVVLRRCGPEVDSPKIGPTKTPGPGLRHEIGRRLICGPLPTTPMASAGATGPDGPTPRPNGPGCGVPRAMCQPSSSAIQVLITNLSAYAPAESASTVRCVVRVSACAARV